MLLLDKILTNNEDPASYRVIGQLNGGSAFEFDLRAWGQKFAFYYREWEKEYIDVLRKLYAGGTFIDIGSSLGLYVIGLSEVVRAQRNRIISIEPVPFNLDRQKRNVELNAIDDLVTYVTDALGDKPGTVRISTDPTMADNNAIISNAGNMEINVVRLDDLVQSNDFGRIGMMKMDVEGYEPLVIQGGVETLRTHRPIVLAEFNRERMDINRLTMEGVWQFMIGDLGYSCYRLDTAGARLQPLSDPGETENLFFLPADVVQARLGGANCAVAVDDIEA